MVYLLLKQYSYAFTYYCFLYSNNKILMPLIKKIRTYSIKHAQSSSPHIANITLNGKLLKLNNSRWHKHTS